MRLKTIAWRLLALMVGECLVGRARGGLVQDLPMITITNFTLTAFLVMYCKGSITCLGMYFGNCLCKRLIELNRPPLPVGHL